jgi:lactoylglutathione lyase
MGMHMLHTMLRVRDLDLALRFWCGALGLVAVRRSEYAAGRFTLVFLRAPGDVASQDAAELELTWNWDQTDPYTTGRAFGHAAFAVDDIHAACARLRDAGVTILRPPRDGRMAFVQSPDGQSVELLQRGPPLPPEEPWVSMPNTGSW